MQQQKDKTLFEFVMSDKAKNAFLKERGIAYNKTVKELRKLMYYQLFRFDDASAERWIFPSRLAGGHKNVTTT